eukprot:26508_1
MSTLFSFLMIICHYIISCGSTASCSACGVHIFSQINNICTLTCEDDATSDQIQLSIPHLSFEDILHGCRDVYYANQLNPSQCNSLEHLIWDESRCHCPSCQCYNEVSDSGFITTVDNFWLAVCTSCTCSEHKWITEDNLWVYTYDCSLAYFERNYQSNQFVCPTKCHGYDGTNPGELWKNGCNEYCYCNFDGTVECVERYDKIFTSTNTQLTAAFMDDYKLNIHDCMNAPSRIINTNCFPKCDCGGHNVGDKWWSSMDDTKSSSAAQTICSECECKYDSFYNYTYTECSKYKTFPIGNGACPGDELKCIYDISNSFVRSSNYENVTSKTRISKNNEYCGWTYYAENDEYHWNYADEYDVDLSEFDDYHVVCDGFVGDGKCIHYLGYHETIQSDIYQYCCKGDFCNDKDIDISICEYNQEYTTIINEYYECENNKNSELIYDSLWCGPDTYVDLEPTCEDMLKVQKLSWGCYCKYESQIYEKLSDEWKTYLQNKIDSDLNYWNGVYVLYGCYTPFSYIDMNINDILIMMILML